MLQRLPIALAQVKADNQLQLEMKNLNYLMGHALSQILKKNLSKSSKNMKQ